VFYEAIGDRKEFHQGRGVSSWQFSVFCSWIQLSGAMRERADFGDDVLLTRKSCTYQSIPFSEVVRHVVRCLFELLGSAMFQVSPIESASGV